MGSNVPSGMPGKTPGVVTAAFIMSVLGFVCGIPAIVGLILGIVGRPKAKAAGSGVGMATAAFVIGAGWILLGVIIAMAMAATSGSSPSSSSPSPEVSVMAKAVAPSQEPSVAETPTEEPAPSSEQGAPSPSAPPADSGSAAPAPSQPAVTPVFEDGDWIVGEDFPPGTYTLINEPSGCYWGIYKGGTNQEDIIANDNVSGGHPTVVLKKGQEFSSSDCGAWATEIPAAAVTEFGDGVWTVGRDVQAGEYTLADEPSGCYWGIYRARSNGEDIVANDNVSGGHPTVVLKKGTEFASSDCGTWVTSIPAAMATEFGDGVWTVGRDIKPGRYRLTDPVAGSCYWGIYRARSNGENIIANDIVEAGRPFVTLKTGQEFVSNDCGSWAPR